MASDITERLNYYQFQTLGAADLKDQQSYHRALRRRHNLGPHSWGVITGLEIVEQARDGDPPFVDIFVMPGIAVDGYGREIIVMEPAPLSPALFSAYNTDRVLEVWIAYDEIALRTPQGGFAPCRNDEAFSRIRETFRFAVGGLQVIRGEVIVAGRPAVPAAAAAPGDPVMPEDELVAFQEFPEDERAQRWHVQLGRVRWDGAAGKFRPAGSPATLAQGRVWAGLRGASLKSESNRLTLAPRVAFADADAREFASIEGRLTVQGRITARLNVDVWGGRVRFLDADGRETAAGNNAPPPPIWMQRLGSGADGTGDLRIHIGDVASKDTRLTIGPGPAATTFASEKVVMAVRGDDRVDIPTGGLGFGATHRQAIDLYQSNSGLGTQGGAVYMRSPDAFYWYRGGSHVSAAGDPGQNGTVSMLLSGDGRLFFPGLQRQVVNGGVGGAESGIGFQQNNFYSRAGNAFAWYVGGVHHADPMNPGGGLLAMSLDAGRKLTVGAGLAVGGAIEITGPGGPNTDPLVIERINRGADQTDLQVVIGDNAGGDDRFRVGPRLGGAQEVDACLSVRNDGRVEVKNEFWVAGRQIPTSFIDVIAGQRFLNRRGWATGRDTFPVQSRRPFASSVTLLVALADIRNEFTAINARWRVTPAPIPPVRTGQNTFSVAVDWQVDDSDGWLHAYSFVAIFEN